ncbi:uncharacterized protein LOC119168044 isoform X2 [Rhipicephalus microplus]|uniref:uncharacterized protein LOC119168044 isoform X2 n=1 Tax=Rhipicephalus microplus TaxID=6941 RepID=UPI003F6BC268
MCQRSVLDLCVLSVLIIAKVHHPEDWNCGFLLWSTRSEIPEPNTTDATVLPVPTPLPIHPTLEHLSPRPGEPGSPENPGTIIPGPSQAWFASVYYRGLIPAERLRRRNQLCNRKTICEEGTCCQQTSRSRRRCKPLGKLGDPCSPRSLSNVYFGMCPCGVNQGTCEDGYCT